VKTHEGRYWTWEKGFGWNPYNTHRQIERFINACHQAGIKVYAWGYVYGNAPEEEAQKAIDSLKLGADGYVWDVEAEFAYKSEAAAILCEKVRRYVDTHCPEKILGYSTFSRVHRGGEVTWAEKLPLEVFDRHCDVAMPQVYWKDFGVSPEKAVYQMCQAWLQMQESWSPGKEPAPIIPIGLAYRRDKGVKYTPPEEVSRFLEAAKGYYGVSFWKAELMAPEHWEALKNGPERVVNPRNSKRSVLITLFFLGIAIFIIGKLMRIKIIL